MNDLKQKINKLLESDVTGYKIHKATGISQARISDLRKGKRTIGNLTVDTALKLYEYQKKLEEGNQK
ncbi:hypothetical protein MUA68_14680 (plasmid) [Staphylococcus aureus]|uniref:hypothetical protein n=1 Tax=Staphylococcus aureus TaxID=1280 RepID=UPI0021CE201A|nr:hypothetical protein [Staphylococcus aureus]UXV48996.1 hypothetical protein MUA24_14665 [Staphylococcus aureus]UXV54416.1 hypothetical protein MUA78_14260 [Staphylococcus aureus]UXV57089.1 hypothetical protein MUA68_14680 [Staphylococcus aureus]